MIDLKIEDFKPEFAGKMNFYLSATDDLLRHEGDAPSIGIILCKGRNEVTVEYSLRDTAKPMGVAQYRLTDALPDRLRNELPTNDDLAQEFPLFSLVALRMQIERELRTLALSRCISESDIDQPRSMRQLTKLLSEEGCLSSDVVTRLGHITKMLNAAAHGIDMPSEDASAAFTEATELLTILKNSPGQGE